jgi:hypothetical protein
VPELTPHERALLLSPGEFRGYSPRDGIAEPDVAPTEPASASTPEPQSDAPSSSNS